MKVIGINHLMDESFDAVLARNGIDCTDIREFGTYGARSITRYEYRATDGSERVAYEATGMIAPDSSSSKVVVCNGRLPDESLMTVSRFVDEA